VAIGETYRRDDGTYADGGEGRRQRKSGTRSNRERTGFHGRAWKRGARMDGWTEHLDAERWWSAIADVGLDVDLILPQRYEMLDKLPWDHVNVKFGRAYLEKEQSRATIQLTDMAAAS